MTEAPSATAILDHLLTASVNPTPCADAADWWARHVSLAQGFVDPMALALVGGFSADRLAYAFASGYQAAGAVLVGARDWPGPRAFCATEPEGHHPSKIATRLDPLDAGRAFTLSGQKVFVTLGRAARTLMVIATRGIGPDGRNRLVLVRVDPSAEGIVVRDLPALPFVPEIGHAAIVFEGSPVPREDVLPGDGYVDYLKPFRTIEDLYVHAALLGYLLQVARRCGWPDQLVHELVACVPQLLGLSTMDPSAATLHVALAGTMRGLGRLIRDTDPLWDRAEEGVRARWRRDQPLLQVASRARAARLSAAVGRLGLNRDRPPRQGTS